MGEYSWWLSMAVHCNEDDVNAVSFERMRSIVHSMNVVSSKSRKKQSRSFETILRAGCRNRESGQAGHARSLMPWEDTEYFL